MNFHKNYVKGCGICQQFKINWNPSAPSFNLIPGPTTTWPFANLSMDLITDLPPVTLDNRTVIDTILSIVDHRLMKGVIAYIGIYCSLNPKTWHKSISTMEFTHNSQQHSDRQQMPFKLIMGTSPLAVLMTFKHTNGRTNSTTYERLRRSNSCPQISLMMYGWMTQKQVLWIQTGPIGLAQHLAPQNQVPQEDGS